MKQAQLGGRSRRRHLLGVAAAVAATTLVLTGCSAGGNDFGTSTGNLDTDVVDTLPADVQAAFQNLDQPIGATPYVDGWKPRGEAPWTIGYASPYDGNSWQAAAKSRLFDDLLPEYQEAGIIEDVVITESGFDDAVQNQQIRQLVDQGVDLIYLCCSNTTSLNQSIEYAHSKGVPTVSFSGYVDSPYAINTSANYFQAGFTQATAIFEKIGGQGNVLDVIGVAGAASSDSFDAGVNKAAEAFPDIKLVGPVEGAWADTVTKTEVQKFLATNAEDIAGVVVQPGSATGALEAFKESGRPIVPISLGGEAGAMCYWINNPDFADSAFNIWPPGDEMELGWEVAIRTLLGQGPKIQSVVREVSPLSFEYAKEQLGTDCDEAANTYIEPPRGEWFPSDMLGKFFNNPADPLS